MSKHVVVLASSVTERRALPHLVAHLQADGICVSDVRVPPRGRALTVEMAENLVKATWYEMKADPPDKFVVLVDVDGNAPNEVLRPFREQLPGRLRLKIEAAVQFAYAQWHLEAWYFADTQGLRAYLKRGPGNVDTSRPDEIQNPKLHLKHLLGARIYTSVIAEEIARALNARTIAHHSVSFCGFLEAVRNGNVAHVE